MSAPRRSSTDKKRPVKKKPEEFLSVLQYSNILPPLPFDPKSLQFPFETDRFTRYAPTTLEKEFRHVILTETDLGIPINLIDPLAYHCTKDQKEAGLDEKDLRLLELHNRPDRPKESSRETVSWLKRTEYMVTDFNHEQIYGVGGNRTKSDKPGPVQQDPETQIEQIEESFEAARRRPVHHQNPDLQPVEIMELLPGEDIWHHQFSHLIFDHNPIPEEYASEPAEYQERFCSRSIIHVLGDKSALLLAPDLDGDGTGFPLTLDEFSALEDDQKVYQSVKKYSFNLELLLSNQPVNNNHFMFFRLDGEEAYYNNFELRIDLRRAFPVLDETKYPLTTVPCTEKWQGMMAKRLSALQPAILEESDED